MKKSIVSLQFISYVPFITTTLIIVNILFLVDYLNNNNNNNDNYNNNNKNSNNKNSSLSVSDILLPKYGNRTGIWITILIVIYCYCNCQNKLFLMYNSLRKKSLIKWKKIVYKNNIIVTICYTVIGIFGFVLMSSISQEIEIFNIFLISYGNSIFGDVFK